MSTTQAISDHAAQKGWDVHMNDVYVGTLTDEQYLAMKREGRKDPMNAVRQALALGAAVIRVILWAVGRLLRDIPVIVFWVAILLGIFSPQSYTELPRDIDPESLRAAVKSLLHNVLILAVLPLTMGLLFSTLWWSGPRNVYADALQVRIRKHFKLTSVGQLTLHRKQ